ncbi:hypothetical protein G6F57_008442 [Rhizopus arrhizus]|nr:hypothetical protein G6F30_006702 [Rhizopus arrhizus]KAG1428675.1 hypothetical protein G6F58_000469 [Rhizopus delemar]KAG0978210.1 hypothetical protein G6F29_009486 [Rhizopus arrhizus]KAG0991006.1 hypothetical protein G6F28_008997 [Rhizopus arrhizus]KAG1005049.1 hypothetical protein G6F27_009580 [Rhizopus arrhizus]
MAESSHSCNNKGAIVLLKKLCPDYEEPFSRFQDMKRHIFTKHSKDLTSRSKKDHGNSTDGIPVHVYNTSNVRKYTQEGIAINIKFSCPGCRDIFNTVSELAHHVDNNHVKSAPSLENLSPKDKRWVLDGHDISNQFIKYRRSCIAASRTAEFAVESHFNELLAMSGILVLQSAVQSIIQQFVDENITETRAKIELLSLCEPVVTPLPQDYIEPTEYECAVIMTIVALLSYLYDCDMKPLSEAHLTASYVHPFMHGLLSAKKPSKVAHCSNIVPEEFDDAVDRPDYKIDVYASSGYRFSYTNAYGEVKKSSNVSVTLLAKDFYRLCIFSKEAIDRYNLRNVLSFQVTANSVTFFTMQLEFPFLYTITELVRLRIPTKKCDLLDLMGHMDNLLFVASLYRDHCVVSEDDLPPWRCDTLFSAYLDVVKNKLAPRKRTFNLTLDS